MKRLSAAVIIAALTIQGCSSTPADRLYQLPDAKSLSSLTDGPDGAMALSNNRECEQRLREVYAKAVAKYDGIKTIRVEEIDNGSFRIWGPGDHYFPRIVTFGCLNNTLERSDGIGLPGVPALPPIVQTPGTVGIPER